MITDSGQADHSSERIDGGSACQSLPFIIGNVILRVFSVCTPVKGLWAVVGGASCAPCAVQAGVKIAFWAISMPAARSTAVFVDRRPTTMRQDRRWHRGSTPGWPAACREGDHDDGGFVPRRVAGSRIVGTLSVSRCAR